MKIKHVGNFAFTIGVIVGLWHVVWSFLVLLGIAQVLLDWVFWMHMLSVPYHVTGFTLQQSLALIIVTFLFGYAGGWVVAVVWNAFQKK